MVGGVTVARATLEVQEVLGIPVRKNRDQKQVGRYGRASRIYKLWSIVSSLSRT